MATKTNKELLQELNFKLDKVLAILEQREIKHTVISCDGSITKNPGGQCAIGVVIEIPGKADIEIARIVPRSSTNNEAEMDAIYEGLSTISKLQVAPGKRAPGSNKIEIVSDSQVVVNGLTGKYSLQAEGLARRKEFINELVSQIQADVVFTWKERNSTPGLNRANELAQTINGVEPH